MSVPQTIGARQSTFTIDSTDVDPTSRTFSVQGDIKIPIENNSSSSSGTDLKLDSIVSSKNATDKAAKKHKLTSINSRLGGPNKTQSDIDQPQAGATTTTNSYSNSNTEASTQLSSSVRKRLTQIHRRKVDIGLLNQAAENTEQAKGIAGHAELYSGEQIIPRVIAKETASSGSNTTSIDTSKIRKTVSFNTYPHTCIDKPSAQFRENRIYHKNSTKLPQNSYDGNSETDSPSTTQIIYPRSDNPKPASDIQAFLSQTPGPQFDQSSIPVHLVQLRHRARNQAVSDRISTDAQISDISNTLTGQTYARSKFKQQIKETPVQRNEPVISDADILNSSVRVHNEQTKNERVESSLELITSKTGSKTAGKDKTIYNIPVLHTSPYSNNCRSSEHINSARNSQETILTPVLESVHVASTDLQTSDLAISQGSGRTQQKVVRPLLEDSLATKQQSTTCVIQLDNGRNGNLVLLENNEHLVNNRKKHKQQSKDKLDKKVVSKSAANIPRSGIQQTEVENSKMARSGKFDYANESFEDVLTERNGMAKTERVYRMRIRQLEEELKQMVHQCQGLSNENKELRKSLDAMKVNKDKFENVDMLAKVSKLESEKAKLVAEYNKKLQQMDSVMLDSAKIRSANVELENKVKELEKQVGSLHSKVKSLESEKTRGFDAKIRELQTTVEDLEYEKKAMEAKIKSLEYDNTSLTDSVESKRREIDDLTNSIQTRAATEANLEGLQNENDTIKQDLTDMNKKMRNLEARKQKLQDLLNEQDNTLKKLTIDNEEKDAIIAKLRKDSELKVQETKKLNESQLASRDKEKESLVSRIASLKAEIDSSLVENCRLKQDREELAKINDKLRQENIDSTEASKESKKYLRKWEQEKEHRSKIEQDLDKKKEEVSLLETRLKETEKTVSMLKNRVKSEDEHDDLNNAATNNPQTNNKVLIDQNMKLRQMLVERNIELTNTKHEQTITHSRIQHLERKQNNAEVRVKQLSEYLGSVIYNTGQESSPEAPEIFIVSPGKKSPTSPTHKNSSKHSPRKVTENSVTDINKIGGNKREQTTSSLPLLDTSPAPGSRPRNGYFTLYREKQKRVKDKGYM